jgi:hypothetical protein
MYMLKKIHKGRVDDSDDFCADPDPEAGFLKRFGLCTYWCKRANGDWFYPTSWKV